MGSRRPATHSPRAARTDEHGPEQTAELEVGDPHLLLALTGPGESHLRALEREIAVEVGLRGSMIRLQGAAAEVALAERVLAELLAVVERGRAISDRDVTRSARTLREHPEVKLRDMLEDVVLVATRQKVITPKGVAQQQYVQAIRSHDLVFGIGPAGTGKTYLAMAMGVLALHQKRVKRIVLTRPAVEAGEKLGFLPGDLAEKVDPYLRPLYDAMHDMMDIDKARALIERGTIEVAPLAFMRGRTLNDSFVILDEAQNTTVEQMKMFLTRLGYDSKAVITGDMTQVDLAENRRSGLVDSVDLLAGVEGIAFCRFTDADVVRHPLVQRIVRAYDERDARRSRAGDPAPRRGRDGTEDGGDDR